MHDMQSAWQVLIHTGRDAKRDDVLFRWQSFIWHCFDCFVTYRNTHERGLDRFVTYKYWMNIYQAWLHRPHFLLWLRKLACRSIWYTISSHLDKEQYNALHYMTAWRWNILCWDIKMHNTETWAKQWLLTVVVVQSCFIMCVGNINCNISLIIVSMWFASTRRTFLRCLSK